MRAPLTINAPRLASEYSDTKDPPPSEAVAAAGVMVRSGRPEFAPGAGVYIADPWVVCFEPTLVPAFLTPRDALVASSVSREFRQALAARAGDMDEIRLGLHPSQVPPGFSSVRDLMERDPLLYFSILPPWNVYCYGAQELAERLNIGDVQDVRRSVAHQDALGLPHSMPLFTDRQAQRRAGIEAAGRRDDWPQLKEKIDAGQLGYVAKCRATNLYALHFKSGEVVLAKARTAGLDESEPDEAAARELPGVGKAVQLMALRHAFVAVHLDGSVRRVREGGSFRHDAAGRVTGILDADDSLGIRILVRTANGYLMMHESRNEVHPLCMPRGIGVRDAHVGTHWDNEVVALTDGSVARVGRTGSLVRLGAPGESYHCLMAATAGTWFFPVGIRHTDGALVSFGDDDDEEDRDPLPFPLEKMRWLQTHGERVSTARFGGEGGTYLTYDASQNKVFRGGERTVLGTIGAQPEPGRLARAATAAFRWFAGEQPAFYPSLPPPRPMALQRAREMQPLREQAWELHGRTSTLLDAARSLNGRATPQQARDLRTELAALRDMAGQQRAALAERPDALCLFPAAAGAGEGAHDTAPNAADTFAMLDEAASLLDRLTERRIRRRDPQFFD